MTTQELQAIRERCDKATAGPWYQADDDTLRTKTPRTRSYGYLPDIVAVGGYDRDVGMPDADWDFVVNARTDVPALLAEVDRLNVLARGHVQDIRALELCYCKLTPQEAEVMHAQRLREIEGQQ